MSALGQKQTSRYHLAMSALPPKADIEPHDWLSALCQKQTRRIGRYGALAVRSAWTKVYQVLAATMQAGVRAGRRRRGAKLCLARRQHALAQPHVDDHRRRGARHRLGGAGV